MEELIGSVNDPRMRAALRELLKESKPKHLDVHALRFINVQETDFFTALAARPGARAVVVLGQSGALGRWRMLLRQAGGESQHHRSRQRFTLPDDIEVELLVINTRGDIQLLYGLECDTMLIDFYGMSPYVDPNDIKGRCRKLRYEPLVMV